MKIIYRTIIINIFLLLFCGRSFSQSFYERVPRSFYDKSLLVGKWKLIKVIDENNKEIELSECAKKEYIEFKNSSITNVSYIERNNTCHAEKHICSYLDHDKTFFELTAISCFKFTSLNKSLLTVRISGMNMIFEKEN